MKDKQRFYNLFKARTTNRIFLFIIGGRGLGKSFSLKKVFVDDFLNKGYQFIYIRRYATELDLTFDNYFNDISNEYPDHTFRAEGGKIRTFYIDEKIAGYACSLSEFKYYKSVALDDVFNLGFDEFLPEDATYIKRNGNPYYEVDQCFNFYQTVARKYGQAFKKGVRFYFIANATDFNNPYFKALNLDDLFLRGAKKVKTPDIYAELVDSNDYTAINEIADSQFGHMIKNTRYGEYAINNTFYNDSSEFIKGKLPSGAKHVFNILYMGDKYGVWVDNGTGIFYITSKYDPKCKTNYALTNLDHSINTTLIENTKNQPQMKILRDAYNNGFVLFKDPTCKYILLTFLGVK